MTKEDILERRGRLLNFIYINGKAVIRHIHKFEFKNYHVAKNYMRDLEKKGLLNSRRAFITGEKVFYITKLGVEFLQTQYPDEKFKYTQVRININNLEHDLMVIDLLLNISLNGFKHATGKLTMEALKSDRILQQERWEAAGKRKKTLYRIPDMQLFMRDPADNKEYEIIVEYEHTRRPAAHIENDFDDYLLHFPKSIIFIVSSSRERMNYYYNRAYQHFRRYQRKIQFWVGHYDFENDKLEFHVTNINEEKKEVKKEEINKDIIKAIQNYFGEEYTTHKETFTQIYLETKKGDYFGYKDYFDTAFIKTVAGAEKEYQENKHLKFRSPKNILIGELQRQGIMRKGDEK